MGALSPSSPKQSPAFRASPPPPPPNRPSVQRARGCGGVGPGPGGWAGWGNGHTEGRGPSWQGGAAGGWSRNAGPAQPRGGGAGAQGARGARGRGGAQGGRKGAQPPTPRSQPGLQAARPPPTAGLIYAATHGLTLIYAAPHATRAWVCPGPAARGTAGPHRPLGRPSAVPPSCPRCPPLLRHRL